MAYAVHGEIRTEDAAPLFPRLRKAFDGGTKIRIYADMREYGGFGLGVVAEKAKHVRAFLATVERMAVVGDARWLSIWARVFDPLTKPELRHFDSRHADEALAWLREGWPAHTRA